MIKELRNIVVQIARMFRVKQGELLPSLCALAVYLGLNALVVARYAESFTRTHVAFWKMFVNQFRISGFDPITYVVLSDWAPKYNIYRHPLLAFFVWPLSVIDGWLMDLTGVNMAQYIVAAVLLFIVFYSYIFMMRICKDIIGLGRTDAVLLSSLLFSFAYVMVSYIVPDHFAPSMFMLLMALYVCGVKIRDSKRLDGWQTMLMFLFTAGITLSNGIKVFIDALFVDGRKFFRPRYLLFAVIIPSALIWVFARWEYKHYMWPIAKANNEAKVRKSQKQREKDYALFRDTTQLQDSIQIQRAFDLLMKKKMHEKYKNDHKQPGWAHKGKPMGKGEFSSWTDISTPRWDSAVENLFGESLILHADHVLGDTLRGRPVIVRYNNPLLYTIEGAIVLLFLAGIWAGRRSRFLWMALCGFGFDMFIHMVLGFGLNEVYIMGAHWLFVIPLSAAFLVREVSGRRLLALRCLTAALALFLLVWNTSLIAGFLLG